MADITLQLPPVRQTASNGVSVRYDSVSGFISGCKVYVLYQVDLSYPTYLITYKL